MPRCCVICVTVISWFTFCVVIRHVSYAQSTGVLNNNRCDKTRVEFIKTPCINCWQNRKVGCPTGSKKQTRGSGTRGCRYRIRVGESTRQVQGCSHTCNQVVVDKSCCTDYWGTECQSCPRDSNDLICGGKGKCIDGMSGNGTCICNGNLVGDLCEKCSHDHFYGPTCQSTCACAHGFCDNGVDGIGKCSCFSGYGGKDCSQELSECSTLTCHQEASCLNITGVVKCHCGKGYVGDGETCVGINPCLANASPCHPQADCLYAGPDKFTCKCKPNFTGDGVWCAPIDPCQTNNGNCPTNSTICEYDGPNQSRCICRTGFENYTESSGCSIIDICGKFEKTKCDSIAECQTIYENGTISTKCICPLGYLEYANRCYSDLLTELDKLNQTGLFQNKLNMAIVFFQVAYKNLIFTPYPLTLFVPLDKAFVLTNPSTMDSSPVWKARARAHIVPGTVPISFLGSSAKTMYPLLGADYPIRALRPGAMQDTDEDDDDDGYFSQLQFRGDTIGKIIVDGKWASNGIIYIVDTLFDLSNETQSKFVDYNEKNVLQVLYSLGRFYNLAMKSFAFRQKLAKTSYSLFVPTDEALSSFGPERWKYINSPKGQPSLDILLEYHMFTEPMSTLALTRVNRIRNIGVISVNVSTEDGLIKVGNMNAKILTSEVPVNQGNILIYIINKILVPDIIRPMINNTCNTTVVKKIRGPCAHCALKICQPGGILVKDSPDNTIPLVSTCVYKVEVASDSDDGSARMSSRMGCSKLCEVNITKTTCCPGFYGHICKSCPGPTHQSCNDHGICSDGEKGSGMCTCSLGFTGFACLICSNLTKYGRNCDQDCYCLNGKCKNTISSHGECKPGSCKEGWAGEYCDRPVQICNNGTLKCHQHASCIRASNGTESCVCDPGYKAYDDGVCTEFNPCMETITRGGCDVNAFCLNMGSGNISCVCPSSYSGDGHTCIPIDPCSKPSRGSCSSNAQCIFTGPGKNRCDCNYGYRGDGTVCEEINICAENNGNCHVRATCSPTGPGTRKCDCLAGYEGNGMICLGNILQEIGIRSDLYEITSWAQKWPSIRQMFMNLNPGFTAFLPNSDAWLSLKISDYEFWITQQHLLYLLQYHIVPEKVLAADLLARKGKYMQTKLSTANIYVNDVTVDSYDYNIGQGTMENSTLPTLGKSLSKILVSNLATSDNGVIHIIDSVLLPPRDVVKDYPALSAIAQNATGTQLEKFQKFLNLLLFSGIIDQIEENHMSTPYTLFLAPDSSPNSPKHINETSVLQYHVISGKMIRASNIRSGQHEDTMLGPGYKLTLVQRHGDILVNGQSVSVADVRTSTGVIHGLSERYLQPVKSRCDKKTTDYAKVPCIPCSYPIQCPESTQLISTTHCLYIRLVSGGKRISVGCKLKCAEEILQTTCCPGFYGAGCEPCPGGIGNICYGFGTCNDGMKGNGTCTCSDNTKYAGVACETCSANRYGRDCENMCKCVNGTCNSGVNGNGACTCNKGYRGTLCDQPTDPNNMCGGMCHSAANCISPNGVHGICVCVAGYKGNGTVCAPVNSCESPDQGGCSIHGLCRYVKPGVHSCTCKAKYEGDGIYCSEINPCLIPGRVLCDPNADCMHIGANESKCVCATNYEGDGKTCKEIDLCENNNGGCDINANCKQIGPGQRYCECKKNYFGNGFTCQGTIHTYVISDPELTWFAFMETFRSQVPNVLNGPNPMILFTPPHEAMLTVQKDILLSQEKATRLFLNHIVSCAVNTKLMKGNMLRTITGSLLNVTSSGDGLFINDTIRINGNTSFWNGIVYKIDRPIFPGDLEQASPNAGLSQVDRTTDFFNSKYLFNSSDTTNLLDNNSNMLKQRGFTWVATLLNISGDLPLLQTEIHQQWTLFLPTDEAFNSMPPQKLRQIITDSTYASEYIRFHMVRESFFTPQNLASRHYLRSMQGSEITMACDAGSSIVGQVIVNQAATVKSFRIFPIRTSERTVPAAVYVIDKVLDPSSVGGRCDIIENDTVKTKCKLHVESVKSQCPEGMKQVSALTDCDIPTSDTAIILGQQVSCAYFKVSPKCCPGYFGTDCHPCPGGASIPCSGNGVCDDGVYGTGKCTCKQGFVEYACERCDVTRYGRNCLSCQCTVHGTCNEGILGDGTCYCDSGWTGDKCDKITTNSSICNPPCHQDGYCVKSGTCLCKPGYIGDGIEDCTFINLCKINNGGCSPYATCSIVGKSAVCKCKANFVGDGYVCDGYDPCMTSTIGCHKEARCIYIAANTSRCECNPGYQGDGIQSCKRTSNKISTCAVNNGGCSGHAICVDVPPKTGDNYPSTSCTCKVKYRGNGYVCHGTVWEVISESLEMRDFYKIIQTQNRLQRKLDSRYISLTMFVPKNVKTSLLHELYLGFQRHFVTGKVYYYKDLLRMSAIKMKSGEFLRIENASSGLFINGARIQKYDILATNGVIHLVDNIITRKIAQIPTEPASVEPTLSSTSSSTTTSTSKSYKKTATSATAKRKFSPFTKKMPTTFLASTVKHSVIDGGGVGPTNNVNEKSTGEVTTVSNPFSRKITKQTLNDRRHSNGVKIGVSVLIITLILVGAGALYWWKNRHRYVFRPFTERQRLTSTSDPAEEDAFSGLTNPAYDSTGFNTADDDDIVLNEADIDVAMPLNDGAKTEGFSFEE